MKWKLKNETKTKIRINFILQDAVVERLEHLSDTVVRLESFAGSDKETNVIFKDYHGLLHVKKLSAFNTLVPHCPHSTDLAFKLRRKKFLIEVILLCLFYFIIAQHVET